MNTFGENSGRYGDRYRRGDGMYIYIPSQKCSSCSDGHVVHVCYLDVAHSSLTHTLLELNAGLMRIITSLLSHDRSEELARRSLLSLSDRSALESVRCLDDLRHRLVASASMGLPRDDRLNLHHTAATSRRRRAHEKGEKKKEKGEPRKARETQMVNGRGKSAVSAPGKPRVPAQSSSNTTHTPKPSHNEDTIRDAWIRSKNASTVTAVPRSPPPPYDKRHNADSNPPYRTGRTTPAASSSPNLTRPSNNAIRTEQRRISPVPQRRAPSPAALHQSSGKEASRASIRSFDSGTTKLGEIPQHKWIRPWVPPVEDEDGYSSDEGDNGPRRRVGFRFWRMFGRKHAVES